MWRCRDAASRCAKSLGLSLMRWVMLYRSIGTKAAQSARAGVRLVRRTGCRSDSLASALLLPQSEIAPDNDLLLGNWRPVMAMAFIGANNQT